MSEWEAKLRAEIDRAMPNVIHAVDTHDRGPRRIAVNVKGWKDAITTAMAALVEERMTLEAIPESIEPGNLNRYPCGCWLRACSAAHERPPASHDALTEKRDRLIDLRSRDALAYVNQQDRAYRAEQERDRLRAALEQIEREWGTSMDNTPLIARTALNAEAQ